MVPTTVIGSFPRSEELTHLYYQLADRQPVNSQRLEALIEETMLTHVRFQSEAGIDIVSSGESARPSFVTYVTQRLHGFEGEHTSWTMRDMELFPQASYAYYRTYKEGYDHSRTPKLTRRVEYAGPEPIRHEISLFTDTLASCGRTPASAFMSVVSPDSIAHAMEQQDVYPSHEAYLAALADALRQECQEIVNAGFLVQVDAPGLLMDYTHHRYEGMDIASYRRHIEKVKEQSRVKGNGRDL